MAAAPFSVAGTYTSESLNGSRSNGSLTSTGGSPPDGTRHIDDLLAEAEKRARDLQHLPVRLRQGESASHHTDNVL